MTWSDRYDIEAGPDEATSAELRKLESHAFNDELWLMVQALLTERRKRAVHEEMKELWVYSLVVGKNRAKLEESAINPNEAPPPAEPGKGYRH